MNLVHEYNEYVVGFIVTDTATNRAVNFQFDEDRQTNHPQPNFYLRHSCEGDDTAAVFSEEELEEITMYLRSFDEVNQLEKKFTALMYSSLKADLKELHAAQGCVEESDILAFYDQMDWVYALSDNGSLSDCRYFKTEEEAQAAIDQMDEDDDPYLYKIVHLALNELHALAVIDDIAGIHKKVDILKEFESSAHVDNKGFVSDQLAKLNTSNAIDVGYFWYLIKAVYGISNDVGTWGQDEPTGDYKEPDSFEEYVIKHIESLTYSTFNKKIDFKNILAAN